MKVTMSLSIILSLMMITLSHPLSVGITLLTQTILISILTGWMTQNFWFSYILFLIMVGGMLILFMYMTSIASNEKFKFTYSSWIIIPMIIIIETLSYFNFNVNQESSTMLCILQYLNFPSMKITLLMIFYLLIVMIISIKLCSFKQGTIRQMS